MSPGVTPGALRSLAAVERLLAAAPDGHRGVRTILLVAREVRRSDALTAELARAATVERLTALGVPGAEREVADVFMKYRVGPAALPPTNRGVGIGDITNPEPVSVVELERETQADLERFDARLARIERMLQNPIVRWWARTAEEARRGRAA